MGSIIARIVARPATFTSLSVMNTSPARIEVSIHNDPRLLAALGAIVSHSAHRAGLPRLAQDGFADAAIQACRDTFPLVQDGGSGDAMLRLGIVSFPDRVEVTIEHSGEPLPTAGLDTFCAGAAADSGQGLSGALQGTMVDRVQYETRDGVSRVTLIKYSGAHSQESKSGA